MTDVLSLLSALQRAACARRRYDIAALVPELAAVSRLCADMAGREFTSSQSLRLGEAAARLAVWPEMAPYVAAVGALLSTACLVEAA
jgi:hypothetical protein